MECGYGTAIFLILMSSSVFVIRGEKASVWGSVYLDEFGEEDIDLRSELFLPVIISIHFFNGFVRERICCHALLLLYPVILCCEI